MARDLCDEKLAQNLRAAAVQYFLRALEVERPAATAQPNSE